MAVLPTLECLDNWSWSGQLAPYASLAGLLSDRADAAGGPASISIASARYFGDDHANRI